MWATARSHCNFYRIHLLCFIILPIIFAGIFVASNGRFTTVYIDALFVCVSAATGTGLSTIDLSSLTAWQQTILVILEIAGNQVFVCWIVVFIRRYYFRKHLDHVVSVEQELRRPWAHRDPQHSSHLLRELSRHTRLTPGLPRNEELKTLERKNLDQSAEGRIRPDMVRRVDIALRPVDPMGVPTRPVTPDSTITRRRATLNDMRGDDLGEVYPSSDVGFGGFPGPREVFTRTSQRLFPRLHRRFQNTLTMPRTSTFIPQDAHGIDSQHIASSIRPVPYLSFQVDVGKNSTFKDLSEEEMLELGGVEYSALNALMWIVPLYYFGLLAIAIIIITPYMALASQYKDVFLPPMQHRKISPIWFSIFQVVGAWANTGMSLVDQNMIPFKMAYPLIFVLFFCVLAGNTAYPVFLRLMIWSLYKLFPKKSPTCKALKFLLDHPRRCFITLFPAHQTWLLLFVLFLMNMVLFVGDLVLNIDNPATDAIPVGTRIALAVLSSGAVRSAGFQAVAVSSLTPATQVLYVIMMYIAIYPIAMSVRSTNVYEENSLGIYPDDDDDDKFNEKTLKVKEKRVQIWGRHLVRHVQKQLSFAHQTWLLLFVLFLMNMVLFVGDLVLNIDNPATDAIPVGTRIALAVLSSGAVRSAGFQAVAVSSLTPATQVLYVIMMYIAIYPIAMSVRSTNVYEENSLGVYPDDDDDDDDDDKFNEKTLKAKEKRVQIWGRHLVRHVQKQLSFDIWWLALSLWLICIVERNGIMDPSKPWFNVFAILFEIVSGYGTVGLSLGIPTANYSLSGVFHILSKLIICAVMLRGRHRGLPVALDRAVMLPHEFKRRYEDSEAAQAQAASPHQIVGHLPEESVGAGAMGHKADGSSAEDSEKTVV
ncbi:uncharacterized protein PHACADRAFT_214314 [Phanerochaete carnosa HHB-10118-sp]|uniref:Potassium transport protein n=1 Tax=Phanerochaete carnosa (strain HHB-10118-sp) TaxID=650164 RepID=K5UJS8_PHACS|nr:uncharacterized protein PHACADRAFT_214314 [Phanerochaete carnosa HHB-10118-sp]EKM49791.1 hypothetical protein PHACADRAFT_214314 [Phanerochaete carnosa HHB-10118-sp]